MDKNRKINFNLQFFADGPEGGATVELPGNANSQATQDGNEKLNESVPKEPEQKTFTQDELNRVATREKRQGKQSVLNAIGVKSEEELKRIVNAYNNFLKAENPQKQGETQVNADYAQLQERVLLAESKVKALQLGISKDCVDDAIAIAAMKAKMEGDEIADILSDMKKNKKYAGFFESENAGEQQSKQNQLAGTGSSVSHSSGVQVTGADFGKQLAQSLRQTKTKSSYFKRN